MYKVINVIDKWSLWVNNKVIYMIIQTFIHFHEGYIITIQFCIRQAISLPYSFVYSVVSHIQYRICSLNIVHFSSLAEYIILIYDISPASLKCVTQKINLIQDLNQNHLCNEQIKMFDLFTAELQGEFWLSVPILPEFNHLTQFSWLSNPFFT